MAKEIIKTNLKNSDKIQLVYNNRKVEMTIGEFFQSLPSGNIVISNTPGPSTSGIYSGSGYLPAHVTVNGLAGYDLYFLAIADFKIFANKFLLEHGTLNLTSGDYEGQIIQSALTDNQSYTLPDNSGQFVLEPVGIKRYKALLSQNAPIASTLNVSMVAGQIWTLDIYSGLDPIDPFNGLELISGTIRVAGSKYRSNVDVSYIFTNTQMSYDGSPYIVSTDVNGDFAPFVNTLGGSPVYSYPSTAGRFRATLAGAFPNGKTMARFDKSRAWTVQRTNDNQLDFKTYSDYFSTEYDGLMNNWLFEIEVYP